MDAVLGRDFAGVTGDVILGKDNRKATNVGEWLEIATTGIAAPGKERIGREIGAHYAEAVEAHREKGETEDEARANALEELGKPDKAAVKFKKENFSEEDEKYLGYIFKAAREPQRSVSVATCFIVLPLYLCLDFMMGRNSEWRNILFAAAWVATCFVLPAVSIALAKRFSFEDGIRWQIRIEELRWLIVGWIPYILGYVYTSRKDPFSTFMLFGITSWQCRRLFRVGGKLRNAQTAINRTPTAP